MVSVKKLRGLLAENSMTQKELADLIMTSKSTVNRKMNLENDFTLTEAEIISNHFGMTIDEIFIKKEKKKAS